MATTRPLLRSRVTREAAGRAVDSLLKWMRAQRKPKKARVDGGGNEDHIYLILTLAKRSQNLNSKPYHIPIPHPLQDPSSVYLVVDDRPGSILTVSAARDLVVSLSLPVSQVISISELLSGILPAGELLFADRRLARVLHGFEKKRTKKKMKNRMFVQLDFSRKSWPKYMRQVCFSTVLNLGPSTCNSIRVGRASQDRDEIVDNVIAAVDGAVQNVPRKWSNVTSFHLKASESLALPIYQKSNWVQNKVDADADADEDDGGGDDGEVKGKKIIDLETEKHINIENGVEKATGKRIRTESSLVDEVLRKLKKKCLKNAID